MSDLHSYPHSFCGNDDEGSHSGFIRRGDDLIDSCSVMAPDASPLSPVSPVSSQLTSLERLELQKLRWEVAELRTALAKHDKLDKKLDDLDKLHHKDDGLDDKHESRWASAASAST